VDIDQLNPAHAGGRAHGRWKPVSRPRRVGQVSNLTYGGAPRARSFGSLAVMKRNMFWLGIDLKGFQPLHFIWQPCGNETH
jgi:hypothetical protein